MKYFGITDKGIIRKQNQDTFACEELKLIDGALLVVCDGMGGARGGNIASKMACEVFCTAFREKLNPFDSLQNLAEHMKEAAETANTAVFQRSEEDSSCYGMGTTLVAASVTAQGTAIINIGDSRAYLISRSSGIRQITRDHSIVADMIERGEITPEQARNNPNRNLITRALGTAEIVPADFFFSPFTNDDVLLLCSDGLTNALEDSKIIKIVHEHESLEDGCRALIQETLNQGAPDNVTAILVRL